MKQNSRAYMSSYEWNYMTLDIVDYIEINLSSKKDGDDGWKLFREYCESKNFNWRVIKKMMEFTVVKVFDSEEELIKCEDFKPLELRQDIIGEEKSSEVIENKKVSEQKLCNPFEL